MCTKKKLLRNVSGFSDNSSAKNSDQRNSDEIVVHNKIERYEKSVSEINISASTYSSLLIIVWRIPQFDNVNEMRRRENWNELKKIKTGFRIEKIMIGFNIMDQNRITNKTYRADLSASRTKEISNLCFIWIHILANYQGKSEIYMKWSENDH